MQTSLNTHIRDLLCLIMTILDSMICSISRINDRIAASADITDLDTDLYHLDNDVYKLCTFLAQLHVYHPRVADPIREMVIVADQPDLLILHTPYLHRRKYPVAQGHCVSAPFVMHALSQAPLQMRDLVTAVSVDILSVYPVGTSQRVMIDPDNISAKRIIDLATMALGIDDNGAITSLSVDAVRSNGLPPGTYTVIRPRAPREDDHHPLLTLIQGKRL